jgi:hypothetical protein
VPLAGMFAAGERLRGEQLRRIHVLHQWFFLASVSACCLQASRHSLGTSFSSGGAD